MSARRAAYTRQSGWVGILAVLLALCIVAIMAGTLLRQYGLAGGTAPRAEQDARGGSAATTELVGGVAPPAVPDAVTPAPRDAINRARGLEASVQQQAADLDKRIDEGSK